MGEEHSRHRKQEMQWPRSRSVCPIWSRSRENQVETDVSPGEVGGGSGESTPGLAFTLSGREAVRRLLSGVVTWADLHSNWLAC